MDKTRLKMLLSTLDELEEQTPQLEQYQTPPEIAAELLHHAAMAGDLDGTVADLGTGNGILALGAAVLGADHVHGYDVDDHAIQVAEQNTGKLEDELDRDLPVTFHVKDVHEVQRKAETVVMNPPFGLQRGNRQANKRFLKTAFAVAPVVYALLHQSAEKRGETRDHIKTLAQHYGFDTTILAWFRFPLPQTYAFHEKERDETRVDLYRFHRSE